MSYPQRRVPTAGRLVDTSDCQPLATRLQPANQCTLATTIRVRAHDSTQAAHRHAYLPGSPGDQLLLRRQDRLRPLPPDCCISTCSAAAAPPRSNQTAASAAVDRRSLVRSMPQSTTVSIIVTSFALRSCASRSRGSAMATFSGESGRRGWRPRRRRQARQGSDASSPAATSPARQRMAVWASRPAPRRDTASP